MLPQMYQALMEVVEKKGAHHKIVNVGGCGGSSASNPNTDCVVQPSLPPPLMQHHQISGLIPLLPLPPPSSTSTTTITTTNSTSSSSSPLSLSVIAHDSDTSEYSDSQAKRRGRGCGGGGGGGGRGTMGTAKTSSSNHELASAISKSASIIAEALQACDERQERTHRDLLSLQEKRINIEESKTEINKEGINGLVDAINKIAISDLDLASHNKDHSSSK